MEADRRAEVWAKTGGRCWYCGTQTSPWKDFHVEHSIPRSKGGTDALENLVPSCQLCNNRKRDKDIEEYRVWLQTKAQHTFWFEQAKLSMAVVQPEEEEDEDIIEWPTGEMWSGWLALFFRGGRGMGPEFILTTIALLTAGASWDLNTEEDYHAYCHGLCSLPWLALYTGSEPHHILAHLALLEDHGFLWLGSSSDGELSYTFRVGEYLHAIRKDAREHSLAQEE